jgi:hypothetical protein
MDDSIKKINERLEESENSPLSKEIGYVTNKFGDWFLDTVPYGWRVYYKCHDIKRWFISTYQRIRYGVSNEECWSLDATFSKFILPRLKHFKKMKRYGYHPDFTPEEWENLLDELIWTFEYLNDDERFNPFPHYLGDTEWLLNKGKTPEQKQSFDEWMKKHNELQERKQKGLELFARYYCHLWD